MVNSSTKFFFDDRWSDNTSLPSGYQSLPSIKNVTLDSGLYSFKPIGEKTIIEDQIQGRDEPYLYNVDFKPLEFTITIAFENYETIDEVTKVITWLYNPNTYKRLKFENMDTHFFAIFIGSPEYYYVGRNNISYKEYIGYITCKVRTNAPYGYTEILTGNTNEGDLKVYPSFKIINTTSAANTVKLTHPSNGSSFEYILSNGETIEFNGYTKTLTSSATSSGTTLPSSGSEGEIFYDTDDNLYYTYTSGSWVQTSAKNPYASWSKDYLIFDPGSNSPLSISGSGQTISFSYRAPKYL